MHIRSFWVNLTNFTTTESHNNHTSINFCLNIKFKASAKILMS
ncbi:hypothetical protein CAMRE0001_2330 [Campylobacter rectus RM3267]|uniref:Uncharacterized protein n=1 Tax=Campylobacter rectus RM3267 TaxID=553218 RepID=B9D5H3_CAMRE|nr:hypothetical protein CAMRE0001_2330 [Campylobacter rectus RM3267]